VAVRLRALPVTDTSKKTPKPVVLALAFASIVGVAVLMVVTTLVIRIVHDHGVLPTPAVPKQYTCTVAGTSYALQYLHGSDRMQVRLASGEVTEGESFSQHIEWRGTESLPAGAVALLPAAFRYEGQQAMEMVTATQQPIVCTVQAK
jgi:hypothetical protein